MKVDKIFVLYMNSDKYFDSYEKAYFNSKKPMQQKQIYYVFTPTMQKCKRVCELEKLCRDYFKQVHDCDYLDIITGQSITQMKLFEEI